MYVKKSHQNHVIHLKSLSDTLNVCLCGTNMYKMWYERVSIGGSWYEKTLVRKTWLPTQQTSWETILVTQRKKGWKLEDLH